MDWLTRKDETRTVVNQSSWLGWVSVCVGECVRTLETLNCGLTGVRDFGNHRWVNVSGKQNQSSSGWGFRGCGRVCAHVGIRDSCLT